MKKIQLKSYLDEDYCQRQRLLLDGKEIWSSRDLAADCPEDATLGRDMTNGGEIMSIVEAIVGEKIDYEYIECESYNDFDS